EKPRPPSESGAHRNRKAGNGADNPRDGARRNRRVVNATRWPPSVASVQAAKMAAGKSADRPTRAVPPQPQWRETAPTTHGTIHAAIVGWSRLRLGHQRASQARHVPLFPESSGRSEERRVGKERRYLMQP